MDDEERRWCREVFWIRWFILVLDDGGQRMCSDVLLDTLAANALSRCMEQMVQTVFVVFVVLFCVYTVPMYGM